MIFFTIFKIVEKQYNFSVRDLFDACLTALRELNIRVEYKSLGEGVIEAATSASIWSWGERIDITFDSLGRKSRISVRSEATAQLFSWGKDSTNEQNIIDAIDKILEG